MSLLKSVGLQWTNKILESSAKIIGAEVLFIILGESFTYKRKSWGPETEPCGTPRLALAQSETLLLFSLSLCIACYTISVTHIKLKQMKILSTDSTEFQFR